MNIPQTLAFNGVGISTRIREQSWQANLRHSVLPILGEREKERQQDPGSHIPIRPFQGRSMGRKDLTDIHGTVEEGREKLAAHGHVAYRQTGSHGHPRHSKAAHRQERVSRASTAQWRGAGKSWQPVGMVLTGRLKITSILGRVKQALRPNGPCGGPGHWWQCFCAPGYGGHGSSRSPGWPPTGTSDLRSPWTAGQPRGHHPRYPAPWHLALCTPHPCSWGRGTWQPGYPWSAPQ